MRKSGGEYLSISSRKRETYTPGCGQILSLIFLTTEKLTDMVYHGETSICKCWDFILIKITGPGTIIDSVVQERGKETFIFCPAVGTALNVIWG